MGAVAAKEAQWVSSIGRAPQFPAFGNAFEPSPDKTIVDCFRFFVGETGLGVRTVIGALCVALLWGYISRLARSSTSSHTHQRDSPRSAWVINTSVLSRRSCCPALS